MTAQLRYSLIGGGCRDISLTPRDLRASRLDARLSARIETADSAVFAQIGDLFLAGAGGAGVASGAFERVGAGEGERVIVMHGGARILGVSAIGETVVLVDDGRALEGESLGRALLRWGCGRLSCEIEPIQVSVLPVGAAGAYLDDVLSVLRRSSGLRCQIEREGSLSRRLRYVWTAQVPLAVIVGPAEAEGRTVQLRSRGSTENSVVPISTLTDQISSLF